MWGYADCSPYSSGACSNDCRQRSDQSLCVQRVVELQLISSEQTAHSFTFHAHWRHRRSFRRGVGGGVTFFNVFFQIQKTWPFTFFELLRTFSQTLSFDISVYVLAWMAVSVVCLSVCWSWPWVVQTWLNRSRYRSVGQTHVGFVNPNPPHGKCK